MKKNVNTISDIKAIIRSSRKYLSVSQEDLANFTGLHRKGIGKLESETSDFKISTLLKIVKLLNIKIILEYPSDGDQK